MGNERCDNCPYPKESCIGGELICEVSKGELREHILVTLEELYKKDIELFKAKANEVCIAAHFWYYFKQNYELEYKNLDMDTEYNRNGLNPKYYWDLTGENLEYAKPDMLIHKRKCNNNNFAYFEFKTNQKDMQTDFKKLKAFTKTQEMNTSKRKYLYAYKYGISIFLNERIVRIVWFEDGNEKEKEEYNPLEWYKK